MKRAKIFYTLLALFVVLFVTGFELRLLKTQLLVNNMIQVGIDYDAFREMEVDEKDLMNAENKVQHLLRNRHELQNFTYIDRIGYLTFSMMASAYDLIDHRLVDETTFYRGIGKVAVTPDFQELYDYNKAIITDLKCFPVPKVDTADVSYIDSWNAPRSYGGERKHEGTDLMASNNQRGFFPVLSITEGIIEKMGWLEQGGYRIGIRSAAGGYFYYAHLYSYAPELEPGDTVIAGQLLGFMGDSGYGEEGTIGKFDVHLHLGIYVNTAEGEMSVNPYWILQILEKYRTNYINK